MSQIKKRSGKKLLSNINFSNAKLKVLLVGKHEGSLLTDDELSSIKTDTLALKEYETYIQWVQMVKGRGSFPILSEGKIIK